MGVSDREQSEERFPVVHMHRGSAIRRPLIVLAVCAVAAVGYVARDFLIPTAPHSSAGKFFRKFTVNNAPARPASA